MKPYIEQDEIVISRYYVATAQSQLPAGIEAVL